MARHVHLIGAGGIGMSALARLLLQEGVRVTGSDRCASPLTEKLRAEGMPFFIGDQSGWVTPQTEVFYSTDIPADHPERRDCSLCTRHRSELLEALSSGKRSVAVTGTHGKTTTTALLSWVLESAGYDPSYAVGGILTNTGSNARLGKGPFVFEADESDRSFLNYHPWGAILTNIDDDHLNHYGTLDALQESMRQFLDRVRGPVVWCADDRRLRQLSASGLSYGHHPDAALRLVEITPIQGGYRFSLSHRGKVLSDLTLSLVGRHQLLNATAVIAIALELGLPLDAITRGLSSFRGVARRCEHKSLQPLILDDYAHHPTEIQVTLRGIRELFPRKRFLLFFQPHRISRTQLCWSQLCESFIEPDQVVITDIYTAGEVPVPGVTSQHLVERLSRPATYVPRQKLSTYAAHRICPDDLVVTMGAGDITHLSQELAALLHA